MSTVSDSGPRARAAHLGPKRRRPQILDAALAITVEEGVGAVTIGALAERLNVTRPVLYSCFADRVEIITALLDRETVRLSEDLMAALYSARGSDPQSAFIMGYQSLLRVVAERPNSWRVVFAARPDPAVLDRFVQVREVMTQSACRWIRPVLSTWWSVADADTKLPILVEFFIASTEAAVRSLLDPSNNYTAEDLGELYGRLMCSAFSAA